MLAWGMGRSVEETQRYISSAEFTRWQAFWLIHGEPDMWQAAQLIAATIANAFRSSDSEPINTRIAVSKINDNEYWRPAMTLWVGADPVPTAQDFMAGLKAQTNVFNAMLNRRDNGD